VWWYTEGGKGHVEKECKYKWLCTFIVTDLFCVSLSMNVFVPSTSSIHLYSHRYIILVTQFIYMNCSLSPLQHKITDCVIKRSLQLNSSHHLLWFCGLTLISYFNDLPKHKLIQSFPFFLVLVENPIVNFASVFTKVRRRNNMHSFSKPCTCSRLLQYKIFV